MGSPVAATTNMGKPLRDVTNSHAYTDSADCESDMEQPCDALDTNSPIVMMDSNHYLQHNVSTSRGRPPSTRARSPSSEARRVLTTASLLAFCFFSICGGPAGSEDLIIAGGPLVGIIVMLAFPILYYIPVAYMTVELSTALPVSGGHAYWVALAFGPSVGFQSGYWSWVSNCIDCSMYAAMTVSSIVGPEAAIKHTFWEFLIKASFAIGLALPGLWSLRVVGIVLMSFILPVLLTYATVSVWATTEADHWGELLAFRRANTTLTDDGLIVSAGPLTIEWSTLLNALVWGYSGFTNLSVFAAHVTNPERTYWRVLWFSSLLIPLTYLIPYMTFAAVDRPDWRLWEDGSLGEVPKSLGGDGVGWWIMVVDLVSSAGLYVCALTASAFLANGMAMQGIAPTTLGLSTSTGTPHGAIFCSLAVILVVVNLEFPEMLQLTNALGGLEAITTILAALRLRFTMKHLRRPIRFCGHAHPVVPLLLLLLPLALLVFVVVDAFHNFTTAVLTVAFLFIGLVYTRQADYTRFRNHVAETFHRTSLA